jgi:hypothetical protein
MLKTELKMSKKILFNLLLLALIISFSCSKNEEIKKLSSTEITNFLLVNEQLPIKTLSNALEWPESIIIGTDLGLVKLNSDGIEKLNDIYNEYKNEDNEDFIDDYQNNKWENFDQKKWVEKIDTKISKTQLLKIKDQELKNNSIAQNNINSSVTKYLDKQFNSLIDTEFGFLSIGFWKNLGQLSLMHFKSIPDKFSNLSVSYLDPKFKNELHNKWFLIIKRSFKTNDLKEQPKITLMKYNSLINLKHTYISKLYKIKNFEGNDSFFDDTIKVKQMESDINLIISKLNLELTDNFGLMFFELLITLIIAFTFNYLLRGLKGNLITTLIQTIFSPVNFVAFSLKNTILGLLGNYSEYDKKKKQLEKRKKYANRFVGFLFIPFSFIYFPIKHTQIENKIKTNIIIPFEKQENVESISIIDNLNTATEIFYTFI